MSTSQTFGMRYTKELLEPLVASSVSIAEVMRKLGLVAMGGAHTHLTKRIRGFGLDTSHFLGVRYNSGPRHKTTNKRSWEAILVLRDPSANKEKTAALRRALLESGRPHKCECGLDPEWNGKRLVLQIEHKNGQTFDNRPDNLVFLCPNCHSQTETYAKTKTVKSRCCGTCGKKIQASNITGICWDCGRGKPAE